MLARSAAALINRRLNSTTKCARMCTYVVDDEARKDDWRSRSNFYNDWKNTEAFGASVKKDKKFANSQDNSDFWLALCDKKVAKVKTRVKKKSAKSETESLEDAVAQATLEMQHKSSVPEIPTPAQKGSKRPKTKSAKKTEKNNVTVSYDNPLKPILTASLMAALDREEVRKEMSSFKAAAAEARARNKKDKLPSVTSILNATMPQENRLALQVRKFKDTVFLFKEQYWKNESRR